MRWPGRPTSTTQDGWGNASGSGASPVSITPTEVTDCGVGLA